MPNPSPVWLVTGASGGLGLALVRQLLAAGHRVAATTRNADKLATAIGDSENLLALTMALTDEADIKRGIAAITERFGCIDVTVNNAGYILVGAIEELTDAEIRANFDTNVFGMMNVIRAVMPVYRAQKSGRFLNIHPFQAALPTPGRRFTAPAKPPSSCSPKRWTKKGATLTCAPPLSAPAGCAPRFSAARRVSPNTRLPITKACATTKPPTAA